MESSSSVNYFFRKSPVIRTLSWIAVACVFALGSLLFGIHIKSKPVITSINPPVGSPGDLIIITGKDFGNTRETSYVEFGGSKLTSSSYISWTDTEIKVVLPANVRDGLVIIETKNARSKPAFFANATAAPVAVTQNPQTTMPLITSITPDRFAPGTLVTISGVNFGNTRENSKVFFSINREKSAKDDSTPAPAEDLSFVAASEYDLDYEYWSDNEIRLYVPDAAVSGNIFVTTTKGQSPMRKVQIDGKCGTKSFISPKTYVIQVEVDIDDTAGDKDSQIILRCPRPFTSSSQPVVEMTECTPEPIIYDFQHTIIHQTSGARGSGKSKFKQNFAVTTYETRTEISPAHINSQAVLNKNLIAMATKADECVPSSNEDLVALAKTITKGEKNPYNIAVLTYNYMLKNFVILNDVRRGSISPLDVIRTKNGDAYDFAITFTALLRASGVPALPCSGVLVETDLKTRNHWWSEFYVAGLGWIPVDIALGAGLDYQTWNKEVEPSQFYFGNLDGQHILFNRGWNEFKPSAPNNKTVSRPRSYSLQSIWEEANGKSIKYSSYWSNPTVIGVY